MIHNNLILKNNLVLAHFTPKDRLAFFRAFFLFRSWIWAFTSWHQLTFCSNDIFALSLRFVSALDPRSGSALRLIRFPFKRWATFSRYLEVMIGNELRSWFLFYENLNLKSIDGVGVNHLLIQFKKHHL